MLLLFWFEDGSGQRCKCAPNVLRKMSEKHSSCWTTCQSKKVVVPEEESPANAFLTRTDENRNLNQYWYSKHTIETLCRALRECLLKSEGRRVAFLSTPSLFFSLSPEEQKHCAIFDVSLNIVRTVNLTPLPHVVLSSFAVRYFVAVQLGISLL